MKIWVIKEPRKKGYVWLVKAYDPITKKTKNLENFPSNRKTQAEAFAAEQRQEQPENVMPADISFDVAFKEYKENVLKDDKLREETRLNKCSLLNNHIAPYIVKEHKSVASGEIRYIKVDKLADYSYYFFKHIYIPLLLKSKKTRIFNKKAKDGGGSYIQRLKDPIGKKTVKDVMGEFKMFVRYSLDRKWKLPREILDYKFSKNFFADYETKEQWVPKTNVVKQLIDEETNLLNKALFVTAAICGPRLNEILAITYDCVDLKSDPPMIKFRHSVDKWNGFLPNKLKTGTSKRDVPISDELAVLLKNLMDQQTYPKKAGKYKLVFGSLTKASSKGRVKAAAKKLGIKWVGGLKPFRKFKYSLTREQGKLTEIQARLHQGWSMDSKTPQRYYHKDLDNNPEQTKDAVNKFLN
tara:strand:- start:1029 stop:2258 length:1230 start_codon:yes stop_codon:yes gene_type:complete